MMEAPGCVSAFLDMQELKDFVDTLLPVLGENKRSSSWAILFNQGGVV